jgi:ABC-type lipoprotein export system ATPase subunit
MFEMDKIIRLRNVGRSFGSKPIFKGVNLEVSEGEAATILGPSGMGKTTLLRIIGTLDKPTEGEVYVCGEDVLRLSRAQLAELRWSSIGFGFQEPLLLPGMSSLDNVLLPCLPRSKGGEFRRYKDKAVSLLEEVGLGERISYKPHQLSVGQKKRVDLVRAIINDPKLLIVDEPTTNLDAESATIIGDMIRRVIKDSRTVILTTHQDQNLLSMADIQLKIQEYQKY